jgi:hypothetical protein
MIIAQTLPPSIQTLLADALEHYCVHAAADEERKRRALIWSNVIHTAREVTVTVDDPPEE